MYQFSLFIVMLTKRGAEAFLLSLMELGYGVQPAGSSKVPVSLKGPTPIVQIKITVPFTDTVEVMLERMKVLLKERELGYMFALIRDSSGSVSWSEGFVKEGEAAPEVPDQWGHLTKAED